MFTRWYKNILNAMPFYRATADNTSAPCCEIKNYEGRIKYWFGCVNNQAPVGFPASDYAARVAGAINASGNTPYGFMVGSGNRPESEFDYYLEDRISTLTLSFISNYLNYDEYGNRYNDITLSATNPTSDSITINEIGWLVCVFASYDMTIRTGGSSQKVLFDRTVLNEPITILPGDTGVINYKIKLDEYPKVVNGVNIVPFAYGSDENIVNVINAARNGIIDLERDAGWKLGDCRSIPVSAIGTQSAYNATFVISSFKEYENCGNIMQLDLLNTNTKFRMNPSNTNTGGYGESEMYSTNLPSFESALPTWLKNLLKSFSVKVSAGHSSSEIVTVENNKVALRSEIEITGTATRSYDGEGEQVDLYKLNYTTAYVGSSVNKWFRSPSKNDNTAFVRKEAALDSVTINVASSTANSIYAFICI